MPGVIDAHVYIGRSIQGFDRGASDLLKDMDRLEIEVATLVPVRPIDYDYSSQNDVVYATRQAHPDRFYGLCRVDARLESAAAEAERCIHELGLNGIYLHPWEDAIAISDRRVDPIVGVCLKQKVPLMVASGYPWVSEALQIADLAGRFPEVPIIATNGAQINISGMGQRNAWLALERHNNVYITTSGVYREDFIEEVMTGLGATKVLFGSQSPLFDQDFELHRILWAHVDDRLKKIVLSDNARRLFGRN